MSFCGRKALAKFCFYNAARRAENSSREEYGQT
jgi:hypothetical protein